MVNKALAGVTLAAVTLFVVSLAQGRAQGKKPTWRILSVVKQESGFAAEADLGVMKAVANTEKAVNDLRDAEIRKAANEGYEPFSVTETTDNFLSTLDRSSGVVAKRRTTVWLRRLQ